MKEASNALRASDSIGYTCRMCTQWIHNSVTLKEGIRKSIEEGKDEKTSCISRRLITSRRLGIHFFGIGTLIALAKMFF